MLSISNLTDLEVTTVRVFGFALNGTAVKSVHLSVTHFLASV